MCIRDRDWKATNPTTWVFNLRKDVTFHNGDKMTAEDVVFSLLRAQQPTSDFKEYISTVTSVKALDDYTVEINKRTKSNSFEPINKYICYVKKMGS